MQTSESEEGPKCLYVTLDTSRKTNTNLGLYRKKTIIEQWYSTVEYPNLKKNYLINNRRTIKELVY